MKIAYAESGVFNRIEPDENDLKVREELETSSGVTYAPSLYWSSVAMDAMDKQCFHSENKRDVSHQCL